MLLSLVRLSLAPLTEPSFPVILQAVTHRVVVDISPNLTIRIRNPVQQSGITLKAFTSQLALVHPVARLLHFGPRIEV
jgi:hypothetical protein